MCDVTVLFQTELNGCRRPNSSRSSSTNDHLNLSLSQINLQFTIKHQSPTLAEHSLRRDEPLRPDLLAFPHRTDCSHEAIGNGNHHHSGAVAVSECGAICALAPR